MAVVTLGAPLGLTEVHLAIEAEHGSMRVPEALTAWINLMDGDDVAAVGDDLFDIFAGNDAGVRVWDECLPPQRRDREPAQVLRVS